MGRPKRPASGTEQARLRDELHRDRRAREAGYRARALKLFPHVCASCGREFEGKRLKELTVHHLDHDHTHNPPDGSNWQLLCIYCHDNEHEKQRHRGRFDEALTVGDEAPPVANPFDALDASRFANGESADSDHS